MATTQRSLVGRTVSDRDGDELGKLTAVYRDRETDRPTWGVVESGRLGGPRFVPLSGLNEADDHLRVEATVSQVESAPVYNPTDEVSPEVDERLERHYGGGRDQRGTERERAGGDGRDNGGRTAGLDRGVVQEARDRQHEEYGGFKLGAAFFGWIVAIGIGALLTGIVSAAGAAIGLTEVSGSEAQNSAGTISIVGGVVLLLVLMLAYYAGGYVAGRLSRFDGARQGLGAWLFGLLVTLALAAAGAIFGAEYNVLQKLDLPRLPVDEGDLTTGGLIALGAILVGTLIAAIVGGKAGERFHKKVDRAALK